MSTRKTTAPKITTAGFPKLDLPIAPPYPPMEAKRVDKIPTGDGWQFEPKWDGFRAIIFRSGHDVVVQSKAGQPLGRYFPEVVEAMRELRQKEFVLDGEIVVPAGRSRELRAGCAADRRFAASGKIRHDIRSRPTRASAT